MNRLFYNTVIIFPENIEVDEFGKDDNIYHMERDLFQRGVGEIYQGSEGRKKLEWSTNMEHPGIIPSDDTFHIQNIIVEIIFGMIDEVSNFIIKSTLAVYADGKRILKIPLSRVNPRYSHPRYGCYSIAEQAMNNKDTSAGYLIRRMADYMLDGKSVTIGEVRKALGFNYIETGYRLSEQIPHNTIHNYFGVKISYHGCSALADKIGVRVYLES